MQGRGSAQAAVLVGPTLATRKCESWNGGVLPSIVVDFVYRQMVFYSHRMLSPNEIDVVTVVCGKRMPADGVVRPLTS